MQTCVNDQSGSLWAHDNESVIMVAQPARPRGYKTCFMLSSTEHELFLLINVKMSTIVGILTFMSGKNSIIGLPELKKR